MRASGGQLSVPTFRTLSSAPTASKESRGEWIFPAVLWRLVLFLEAFQQKKNIRREFTTTVDYPKGKGATAFSFLIRGKMLDAGEIVTNISLILRNEA